MTGRLAGAVLATVLMACGGSPTPTGDDADVASITVAAASDLRPAFEVLARDFTTNTGIEVVFTFGSSGLLREQVINGAPFDLYVSANAEFVDAVIAAGRGDPTTRAQYAVGRLALWSPPGFRLPASVAELSHPQVRRIAVANPSHAPYGMAAVQALQTAGVYDMVQPRLVYGENIADALRITRSGNADVGLVALSLAIAEGTPYQLVPDTLHAPISQTLVVTSTGASARAAATFVQHLTSDTGRRIMADFGFETP